MKKSAATPALWQRRHTDRALFFSHTKSVRLENRAVLGGRTSTSVHLIFFFFLVLEPFGLMNAPQKMSVPCITVYGWTFQLHITRNLSFYIIYFIEMCYEWTAHPPFPRDLVFYQWTLITATQMGHGWRASEGKQQKAVLRGEIRPWSVLQLWIAPPTGVFCFITFVCSNNYMGCILCHWERQLW